MTFKPILPVKRYCHILEHVYRNRMTVRAVLQLLFWNHQCSLNAITQVTSQLVDAGWLTVYPLFHTHRYFTLGPRCRKLGVPRRLILPIGEQSLPLEYASLIYCCNNQDKIVRKRLLPEEIRGQYPWFPRFMLRHPCYFDHYQQKTRLAMIRVELCHSARFIIDKQLRHLYRYRQLPEFANLLDVDQFMFVTMTPSEHVCQQLENVRVAASRLPPGEPVSRLR